jgi:hypothetical protein
MPRSRHYTLNLGPAISGKLKQRASCAAQRSRYDREGAGCSPPLEHLNLTLRDAHTSSMIHTRVIRALRCCSASGARGADISDITTTTGRSSCPTAVVARPAGLLQGSVTHVAP